MFLVFRYLHKEIPSEIMLSPEECRHLRARRIQSGQLIYIGDCRSRRWPARLKEGCQKAVLCGHPVKREESVRILCSCLPEGSRWERSLSDAVELGMTHFQPLYCDRSEKRSFFSFRNQRIILSASAQSRRFFLPKIFRPKKLNRLAKLLRRCPSLQNIFVMIPDTKQSLQEYLRHSWNPSQSAVIIVGPEGGFTPRELDWFSQQGYPFFRLSPHILRVGTAGIASLAMLS